MKEMNQVSRILKKYEANAFFCGAASEQQIKESQERLKLKFPQDYREFLMKYGAGNFGACEIYGIIPDKNIHRIPDGIWATEALRQKYNLSDSCIVIGFDGFGGYYCLDTAQMNKDGLCPVVLIDCSEESVKEDCVQDELQKEVTVVAENFAVYFLSQLKQEIDKML